MAVSARTVSPASPAASLLPVFTDGRAHVVIVTDASRKVIGVISQTDLLSALGRLAFTPRTEQPGLQSREQEPLTPN